MMQWVNILFLAMSIFFNPSNVSTKNNDDVVVLELFTSQGCSSCPTADKVLNEIAEQYSINDVIPLSFHVDYWNRLGWKDPYSTNENTERQYRYATLFNKTSVYTPQIIINSKFETVGSDKQKILKEISTIKKIKKLELSKIKIEKNAVTFSLSPIKSHSFIEVYLVAKQEENKVPRGENAGRYLSHKNVVKKIWTFNSNYANIKIDTTLDDNHFLVVINRDENFAILSANTILSV